MTTYASVPATRCELSAYSRSRKNTAPCVTKTKIVSAARPPSACAKSARARSIPLRNAATTPSRSTIAAGTARPMKASQTSPGRMNTEARNGNGRNTTTPVRNAVAAARLRNGTPCTIEEASTKDAVNSTDPAVTTNTSAAVRSSSVATRFTDAAGTPTRNAFHTFPPYAFNASATSWPTVRATGGSAGGSGSEERAYLATREP